MHPWILDVETSHTIGAKYFQMDLLYWHMKSMLVKALLDHTKEQKEILSDISVLQDNMAKINANINLIVKDTTRFEFVDKVDEPDDHHPVLYHEMPLISISNDDEHSS